MIADLPDAVAIAANLADVRVRMAEAALAAGRSPDAVQLVAVSKTHPLSAIAAAYAAGQRDFGENRLEELWPKVRAAQADDLPGLRWHMIGTIQSRKTGDAIGPFALIHAVDRVKIAERLSRDALAAGKVMEVLLEVNVSGEASKHGFTPDEVRSTAPAMLALTGIRIRGLMTMAPLVDDPEAARPSLSGFARAARPVGGCIAAGGLAASVHGHDQRLSCRYRRRRYHRPHRFGYFWHQVTRNTQPCSTSHASPLSALESWAKP